MKVTCRNIARLLQHGTRLTHNCTRSLLHRTRSSFLNTYTTIQNTQISDTRERLTRYGARYEARSPILLPPGKPGKITMKIGFITPFYPALSGLADLGKQYLEGFQTALEMFNNDDTLAVDFLGIELDSGENPSQSCQDIASTFAKSDVVAVIGAYRSICSMKAADILGRM